MSPHGPTVGWSTADRLHIKPLLPAPVTAVSAKDVIAAVGHLRAYLNTEKAGGWLNVSVPDRLLCILRVFDRRGQRDRHINGPPAQPRTR